jgi:predicted kinase
MGLKLIIFSGLPGVGKSKLADYASKHLGLPIIAKDWVEATLWKSDIRAANNSGAIAYDLLTDLAKEQLRRNVSVILDSVAVSQGIRDEWRTLAEKYNAHFVVIECVCSNEGLHKDRMKVRKRNIEGWAELKWEDVLEVKLRYAPWKGERLILDSVNDFQENVDQLITHLNKY